MARKNKKRLKSFLPWAKANKILLAAGILGLVLIAISSILLLRSDSASVASGGLAAAPTDNCAQNDEITFSCYKHELEQIIAADGPEPAFALIKSQYDKVPYIKSQCHQLVHVIGRSAYLKYGSLGDTFTHGDQFCWSGYYHGALEELSKQKGEETVRQANSICADLRGQREGSFDHYNCVHGLGHGFMFILGQDLFKSLKACDSLTDSFERTSCYGGVFMQNIMNVQTPDREEGYVSATLKENDPMYPCTALEDRYKQQCYLMQTSYALQTVGYDFSKVFQLCDATEAAYRDTCYTSIGRDASGQSVSDVERTKTTCLLGKDYEAQSYCINGAAKDFVSYYHDDAKARQLCGSLSGDLVTYCQSVVASYYASF